MATIKSYTDLEQSKKLAEILPLESADMFYPTNSDWEGKIIGLLDVPLYIGSDGFVDTEMGEIHAWSLAALLRVLTENKICHYDNRYYCQYMSEGDEFPIYSTAEYDNPVDACVAMIEKSHELNLL